MVGLRSTNKQCAQAIITDTLLRKETDQYGEQRVRLGQEQIFLIF